MSQLPEITFIESGLEREPVLIKLETFVGRRTLQRYSVETPGPGPVTGPLGSHPVHMTGFLQLARVRSESAHAQVFRVLVVRPGATLPRLDAGLRGLCAARFSELQHESRSPRGVRHDNRDATCGTTQSESN
jgi:hypothetical protein